MKQRQVIRTLMLRDRYERLSQGLPVPVLTSEIPLGYKINPDDPLELIKDPEVFDLLIRARKYLKDSSIRDTAEWLRSKGVKISHQGLHKLMKLRPPYDGSTTKKEKAS